MQRSLCNMLKLRTFLKLSNNRAYSTIPVSTTPPIAGVPHHKKHKVPMKKYVE